MTKCHSLWSSHYTHRLKLVVEFLPMIFLSSAFFLSFFFFFLIKKVLKPTGIKTVRRKESVLTIILYGTFTGWEPKFLVFAFPNQFSHYL